MFACGAFGNGGGIESIVVDSSVASEGGIGKRAGCRFLDVIATCLVAVQRSWRHNTAVPAETGGVAGLDHEILREQSLSQLRGG